jgi:CheY-specific phosphatase CheX
MQRISDGTWVQLSEVVFSFDMQAPCFGSGEETNIMHCRQSTM